MGKLSTNLGTPEQGYKFDGTNYIDVFPVLVEDSTNPTRPSTGTITIQGVTIRTELWSEGDNQTVKFELNHEYKDGGNIEFHMRVFPINDNAGTVNYSYTFFVTHVDCSTSVGGVATGTATFEAGDKTLNKGQYVSMAFDGTNLVAGDMTEGVLKRETGTYASNVSKSEFGCHIPIGQTGTPIGI